MIELGSTSPMFAQSWRVDSGTILENSAGWRISITDIVRRSTAVHLLGSEAQTIIGEGVGGGTRISDARHSILIIVGQAGDIAAYRHRGAVSVGIVSIRFAASSSKTDSGEFVVRVVGVGVGDRVEYFGRPISIVVEGVGN